MTKQERTEIEKLMKSWTQWKPNYEKSEAEKEHYIDRVEANRGAKLED